MFHFLRVSRVTCVITCLVAVPWTNAFANERQDVALQSAQPQPNGQPANVVTNGITIPGTAFAPVAGQYRLESRARQSVASTNEPKLLLGVAAGALIVTGVAMLAYGATSTCKGLHDATSSCDKKTVMGAMGLSGGTVMLVVWALSKP